MVGLRVIACNKQDGLYYPGKINTPVDLGKSFLSFYSHFNNG